MKGYIAWMAATALLLPAAQISAQSPESPKEIPNPKGKGERQTEKVAFLGVAVVPAPPSLRAQLGLPEGTGLLVLHVEPDSAAVGKIEENDVLTRFNDQILVNQDQLTVLVANSGIGAEVKVTLIRQKNEQTVAAKLGEHDAPRGPWGRNQFGFGEWNPGEPWMRKHEDMVREWKERAGELREKAGERLKEARERREQRQAEQPEREQRGGAEERKQSVVKHSTWVESGLMLNLIQTDGNKRLTVEKNGQKVFEGPVNTEEERQKVPQEYRDKLDKMDAAPAALAPESKPKKDGGVL